MIYLQLFWSFFQIGLFSIGGGYAAMPLIQAQIVDIHKWLSIDEFIDLITIAEMTPGPIAINSSTFVGTRIAGFPGALVATFGCILPSFIISLTLAFFYYKYKNLKIVQEVLNAIRPTVVALIATAGISIFFMAMGIENINNNFFNQINIMPVVIFIVSLFLLRKFKLNPIFIIFGSGIVGLAIHYIY